MALGLGVFRLVLVLRVLPVCGGVGVAFSLGLCFLTGAGVACFACMRWCGCGIWPGGQRPRAQ